VTARVQRLDPDTASRIAAGEVIERPTSVVKELIDNALDAGSSRIDNVLQNGGRRLIQVTDNGCGMTADEAVLALNRFTTSKIRQWDDLTRLTTLGFRGEALPSIAAMAEVEIVTRPAALQEGVVVQSRGEPEPQARPIGSPLGTRVRVQRLFAQTPVRLNALKSWREKSN
jgi:DNA mismatch repair protein MutL